MGIQLSFTSEVAAEPSVFGISDFSGKAMVCAAPSARRAISSGLLEIMSAFRRPPAVWTEPDDE
jgi:hypothetical protein